jgi:hypothetical protein
MYSDSLEKGLPAPYERRHMVPRKAFSFDSQVPPSQNTFRHDAGSIEGHKEQVS